VTSSTTCQRLAGKISLDSLNRRKATITSEPLDNSFREEFSNISSAYILEIVPTWISTPSTVNISSCNVVCWTASASFQTDEAKVFRANMDDVTHYTKKLVTFTYLLALALIVLYTHRSHTQYTRGVGMKQILCLLGPTLMEDIRRCLNNSIQIIWWSSLSSVMLVHMAINSAYDFKSSLKASWVFFQVLVMQSLIGYASALIIIIAHDLRLFSLASEYITRRSNLVRQWRLLREILHPVRWFQGISLIMFSLVARNLAASAHLAFALHIWNQYVNESRLGVYEQNRIEEAGKQLVFSLVIRYLDL
jgi:hypothetical protein